MQLSENQSNLKINKETLKILKAVWEYYGGSILDPLFDKTHSPPKPRFLKCICKKVCKLK